MSARVQGSSKDDPFEVANAYRKRLEALVVRLLMRRFRSRNALWKMQVDLLKLQREIQASISKRNAEKKTPRLRSEIAELKIVRWHARRFGDALAWVLFKGERQSLYPLSENESVPVMPEDGKSALSLIASTEVLSDSLGLPLLHDITDLLRIGDVTFFRPDGPPRTVELKSALLEQKHEGDQVRMTYQFKAIWPPDGKSDEPPPKPSAVRPGWDNERFARQLERMSKAHAAQTAELGKPAEIGGQMQLMIPGYLDTSPGHWALIRRLIRIAKRTGYAAGSAEDSVLYVVSYNPAGFHTNEDLPSKAMVKDVAESTIWFEDRSKNSLLVSSLPDLRGTGPHRYLPYFLYSIPRPAVLDILYGRLIVMSLLNVGRLAAAIEKAGFVVESSPKVWMPRIFAKVDVQGTAYRVEMRNLHHYVKEMIMEARSLQYAVGMVHAVAQGVAAQAPDVMLQQAARDQA